MKTNFGFIDPGVIMGVVVSLIILAVGVFAFFVTVNQLLSVNGKVGTDGNWTNVSTEGKRYYSHYNNTTGIGNSVFNIMGIVLIIGAIISIIGLVYNYIKM